MWFVCRTKYGDSFLSINLVIKWVVVVSMQPLAFKKLTWKIKKLQQKVKEKSKHDTATLICRGPSPHSGYHWHKRENNVLFQVNAQPLCAFGIFSLTSLHNHNNRSWLLHVVGRILQLLLSLCNKLNRNIPHPCPPHQICQVCLHQSYS